ncbi:exosortase [Sphingomonas sp. YR710]|uniref:exosortase V n=1 Tax=Sphingomonas sp. YR710 TaxID=1882773 RepID=UPI000889B7BC|nr:exosortase V [Sphingomonas sp. YR710]SDD44702.1 exosortase [Sphingomonas sp. YR710]
MTEPEATARSANDQGTYGLADLAPLLATMRQHWLLLLGAIILAVPTMFDVARENWSTEQGAHGPIVLATGLWLFSRRWPEVRDRRAPGDPKLALLGFLVAAPLFVLARITSVIEVEGFMMYGLLLTGAYYLLGTAAMRGLWFPIVYMLFIFPPPDTVVAIITQPLKIAISQTAINLLYLFGYPIAGSGVTIAIGQYQLLIAAACAGLNSLISLSAIGLFYIYIRHNANWRYALLLMFAIVPVAIMANFIRVIVLILITYYLGDAAAQGFLHSFSGITMFLFSVLGIFGVDALASPLRRRLARGQAQR